MERIRVSIVEDIHEIRNGFAKVLNDSPEFICISGFSNAESALESIPADPPDVIVMDINLPLMSGIRCIQHLRNRGVKSHVLMFTVYDDDENIFEALRAGAGGYILKKTSPEKFLEAIHEIMEGGAPMTARIARRVVQEFRDKKENVNSNHETDALSSRELEILNLLSSGYLYKEIAENLNITTGTVKQHIHKIYSKLHVQNRTEAINKLLGR